MKPSSLIVLGGFGLVPVLALALTAPTATPSIAPRIDSLPWAATAAGERQPQPSEAEWSSATVVSATRATGERSPKCQLRHLRLWLEIRCAEMPVAAITQLAGPESGTRRRIEPEGEDRMPGAGTLRLRLTRGVSRVFTFWTFGPGYDGPLTVVPAVEVQIAWWPEQDAPTVITSDALYEPMPTGRNPQ